MRGLFCQPVCAETEIRNIVIASEQTQFCSAILYIDWTIMLRIKKHCKVFCKLTHVVLHQIIQQCKCFTQLSTVKTVPPSHFITAVFPPSNTSLVPEANLAFQFGNILMILYLIPLSSSVSQSSQLMVWHSRSCSTIHFLYISYFTFHHFASRAMLLAGSHTRFAISVSNN